jgi:DNA-binding transcriptional regulator YdaS (Cro superfamily)
MPEKSPLLRAIDSAGGMTSLARKLTERGKVIKSHQTIYQWTKTQIPAEYCPDVEALTGVKCEELRPDVNWAVLRTTVKNWNGVERRKQPRAA